MQHPLETTDPFAPQGHIEEDGHPEEDEHTEEDPFVPQEHVSTLMATVGIVSLGLCGVMDVIAFVTMLVNPPPKQFDDVRNFLLFVPVGDASLGLLTLLGFVLFRPSAPQQTTCTNILLSYALVIFKFLVFVWSIYLIKHYLFHLAAGYAVLLAFMVLGQLLPFLLALFGACTGHHE